MVDFWGGQVCFGGLGRGMDPPAGMDPLAGKDVECGSLYFLRIVAVGRICAHVFGSAFFPAFYGRALAYIPSKLLTFCCSFIFGYYPLLAVIPFSPFLGAHQLLARQLS